MKKKIINDNAEYDVLSFSQLLKKCKDKKIFNLLFNKFMEAFTIKIFKMNMYGLGKYSLKDSSINKIVWLCYSDVNKKFVRLERLSDISSDKSNDMKIRIEALKKLHDDYIDLINFSLDGSFMIERVIKKMNNLNKKNGDFRYDKVE